MMMIVIIIGQIPTRGMRGIEWRREEEEVVDIGV